MSLRLRKNTRRVSSRNWAARWDLTVYCTLFRHLVLILDVVSPTGTFCDSTVYTVIQEEDTELLLGAFPLLARQILKNLSGLACP